MEDKVTRSLGLDIGDVRIGVALSDPCGILASPLTIINRSNDPADIEAIIQLVEQNHVGQIIVGLPLSMDGGARMQAEKARAFAREIGKKTGIPIKFRDERLTTVLARRLKQPAKRRDRSRHDAIAAAIILQGYLDESNTES